MAITRIVQAILGDENSVLTVSAKLCGEYGCKNVFAGVPCIIGRNGVKEVIELSLTDEELVDVLQQKGYKVARRTVAKYREQLNIPIARLRKEL